MIPTLVRLARSAVTTLVAGWFSIHQNDPKYLAVIPILHALGKWLRDTYPTNPWVNALTP
jgi:hypothetical protein